MNKTDRPIPEALLDKSIAFFEGPVNRTSERIVKSRLFLTPLGLSWRVWCRSALAVRDQDITHLWKRHKDDMEGVQR